MTAPGAAPALPVTGTPVLEARSLPLLPAVRASEIVSFLPGFQFQQSAPYAAGPPLAAVKAVAGK